jgi:hypothetical protein
MRTITESEYDAIHPDFRGIWLAERDDQPNWANERHLYIGKRTMMAGDGTCSLLVEGLGFRIVPDVPAEYRGWSIDSTPVGYRATSPDYDAEFDDGMWRTCGGGLVHGSTIDELKVAVDDFIAENSEGGDE